jgi:restriction system-associated AAA family ATPase
MRLLRLKLNTPFRSLHAGFEVNFLREWDYDKAYEFNPYCLVGRNGSGKSNILEALASIFYHLESLYLNYRPDDFDYDEEENPNGYQSEKSFPDAFELEYFFPQPTSMTKDDEDKSSIQKRLGLAHISVTKKVNQRPEIYWLNREELDPSNNKNQLTRVEARSFLPNRVLAYSSGDNEILSLPFFKMRFVHYDEYVDRLTKGLDYSIDPEGRLMYLDNQFSQAILLSNYLLQEAHIFKPFKEELGFEYVKKFRIIIRKNHFLEVDDEYFQSLSPEDRADESKTQLELTSKLSKAIERLERCTTSKYFNNQTKELFLDYWVNEATREAFKYHFGDALTLFQTFQILLTLNLYDVKHETKKEIYQSQDLHVNETIALLSSEDQIMRFENFVVKKEGVEELIYSKALSDGEHQFLHALGLCLLFKDQPNLFFLDEPGTHFNPDWRAKFISSLRACFEADQSGSIMREMLITSHSPFIVSDCQSEYVLVFEKDEKTNKLKYDRPDFKTFGASVNQLTMRLFEKKETIGGYAMKKLKELETRFEDGEDGSVIIKEANKELGDSVEKIVLINKILDQLEASK